MTCWGVLKTLPNGVGAFREGRMKQGCWGSQGRLLEEAALGVDPKRRGGLALAEEREWCPRERNFRARAQRREAANRG